jgi:hypothetical protein
VAQLLVTHCTNEHRVYRGATTYPLASRTLPKAQEVLDTLKRGGSKERPEPSHPTTLRNCSKTTEHELTASPSDESYGIRL